MMERFGPSSNDRLSEFERLSREKGQKNRKRSTLYGSGAAVSFGSTLLNLPETSSPLVNGARNFGAIMLSFMALEQMREYQRLNAKGNSPWDKLDVPELPETEPDIEELAARVHYTGWDLYNLLSESLPKPGKLTKSDKLSRRMLIPRYGLGDIAAEGSTIKWLDLYSQHPNLIDSVKPGEFELDNTIMYSMFFNGLNLHLSHKPNHDQIVLYAQAANGNSRTAVIRSGVNSESGKTNISYKEWAEGTIVPSAAETFDPDSYDDDKKHVAQSLYKAGWALHSVAKAAGFDELAA